MQGLRFNLMCGIFDFCVTLKLILKFQTSKLEHCRIELFDLFISEMNAVRMKHFCEDE